MIIADFCILCVGQEKRKICHSVSNLEIETIDRNNSFEPIFPEYNFHKLDREKGWMYIYWADAIQYKDSFFELHGAKKVSVTSNWYPTICELLNYYLSESPTGCISVLIRAQDVSRNIVHDGYSVRSYVEELVNGKININEVYFLYNSVGASA